MDFDTIDTDMFSEIADAPGEIFDISDEDREEMAKVFAMSEEEYYYYWNSDDIYVTEAK